MLKCQTSFHLHRELQRLCPASIQCRTTICPPAKRLKMAFPWRVDSGPLSDVYRVVSLCTCARQCYTHPNLMYWLNLCSIYASNFWVVALKCCLNNVYLNDNHALVRSLHFPAVQSTINRISFPISNCCFASDTQHCNN